LEITRKKAGKPALSGILLTPETHTFLSVLGSWPDFATCLWAAKIEVILRSGGINYCPEHDRGKSGTPPD
jgi:hypothetical protein